MAANIAFIGAGTTIQDLSGSGLGFFGAAGWGASVQVGAYQGRTFITNGAGSTQGAELQNTKFLNSASGILGQTGSGIALTAIPNYQCPLQIRFTYDSAVKTQNVQLRIYDRVSVDANASGVTTKVAEIIHPGITQSNTGSGDTSWLTPGGSGSIVSLAPSPGCSGMFAGANGADGNWSDTTHDWYLAISASPDSIGAKSQFALQIALEYL
jgi:hypothetical protein